MHNVATQYATDNEAAKLRPTVGSREATPSSSKEASSDVTVHDANEDTKSSKKRRNQRPQWVTTAADYNGGNDDDD
jgi:hypothetical protein